MIKKINYFFQSVIIYFFYIISKIIGLKLSRIFFSFIFEKLGNLFKSKKIIDNNLNRIKPEMSELEKELIIKKMWSNYGKILAGSLESSNTNISQEMVSLIKTQQAFNGNARILQSNVEVTRRLMG